MALLTDSLVTDSYTSGGKYANVRLEYTLSPINASKANITWKLRLSTNFGYIVVGELSVKINGVEIYYRSPDDAKSASNNDLLASGAYTVEENPVVLYVGAGIYEHEINKFNSISVQYTANDTTLNTLKFTNPGTVGEEFQIINNTTSSMNIPGSGWVAGTRNTIRYEIGILEGVIAEKTKDKIIKWIVPTQLYEIYPNSSFGQGYIHCDTYRMEGDITPGAGDVFIGTRTYPFSFNILDKPVLEPTVKDIDPITLALTGDENTFVRFFSDAQFAFNAAPGHGAKIDAYMLECDPYKLTDAATTGTLENVESGNFIFSVRDTRDYTKSKTVEKKFLEYKKLTCNIWRVSATADGTIVVGVGGDYWAHNFGAKHNSLKISYRYKAGSGEFSEWVSGPYLTDTDDYEFTVTLEDLDYRVTYTFEAMVQDELMTVVSRQLPVHCVPVYDWGENDFNVNVNFNMNHQTILRHNHQANNLVVSSSGGFIYFRPKGTDDTSAEIKFTPQGNIELTGDILINGKSLKSLLKI